MENAMLKAKRFSNRYGWLVIVAATWLPCGDSQAAPQWSTCAPAEVTTYQGRIHVRCQSPVAPGIVFLALSTTDPQFASRMLGIGVAAFVSGKSLTVFFDPSDLSGQAVGCMNTDCRLIQALGIVEPTPASSPSPPPTPRPPTPAELACLNACSVGEGSCMAAAHSAADRQACVSDRKSCDQACRP